MTEAAHNLLSNAYFYLRFRARTAQEMRTYLSQKAERHHASREDIDAVMQELTEIDLINDRRFIEEYVTSKTRNKPRGQYALSQELLRKGIHHDLITQYFRDNALDEEQLASAALHKVWNRYRHLEFLQRQKRATDFLRRRGFGFAIIQKTIQAM